MSDGGKGSSPRPFSVSNAEYAARWDTIFGKEVESAEVKKEIDELLYGVNKDLRRIIDLDKQ